jgi:hypothetical protein
MPDFRSMYDSNYLYAFDLKGRDVTVTIREVKAAKVRNESKEQRKPILYFKESHDERGLVLCKTNGKTIAQMYGSDTDKWLGKRITLFPTTTSFGPNVVDCIRIRPLIPKTNVKGGEFAEPDSVPSPELPEHAEMREPGDDEA